MSGVGGNPIDRATWPERITARVVQPGAAPRLHGYDLRGDLAAHYRLGEVVFLALAGELPEERLARAVDLALIFLSTVTVAEAPGHAAVLAGLCGTTSSAATGVVAIALGEQARCFVARLLALPAAGQGEAPGADAALPAPAESEAPDPGVAALRARLDALGLADLPIEGRLGAPGAALSLLRRCGLTEAPQLEAAWVLARLPVALAEAWRQHPGQFLGYPTQLPRFIYRPEEAAP